MDLKSMLNDSAGQRGPPRISTGSHTPHSSFDARLDHTPSSDVSSARPTPYAPPLQTGDSRSHGGGGYFGMQSPHPNTSASASTPSVGPPSAYAQSPGPYSGVYTPRDSLPPSHISHNAAFVSPTPSSHNLPTPGSAQQPHPQLYHQNSHAQQYQHFQSPPPPAPNGLPPSQHRQISPASQFHHSPATPLGPPLNYHKASPLAQRPPSQGGPPEHHLRRASQSSIGSVLSRDYNSYPPPIADHSRRESSQRPYPEYREREQSMSVSPKTIPKPIQRDLSVSSRTLSHGRTSLPPQPERTQTMSQSSSMDQVDTIPGPQATSSMSSTPHVRQPSNDRTMYSSPAHTHIDRPIMSHTHTQVKEEDAFIPARSLKRSASLMSDATPKPAPPKRARHEIPVWAQSARKGRPFRRIDAEQSNHNSRPQNTNNQRQNAPSKPEPMIAKREDARPGANGAVFIPPAQENGIAKKYKWEGTISNVVPTETIVTRLCDWIAGTIGTREPPRGSSWEIEAKVGQIQDVETHQRLRLANIDTEVMLRREGMKGIRFVSDMAPPQHEALWRYLHDCLQQNHAAATRGEVQEAKIIRKVDLQELDEFYELSEEGRVLLDPELQYWITHSSEATRRKGQVRVRQTIDVATGQKTYLIKTRIADKEIHIPEELSQFDYRVSISLETPWTGDKNHLRLLEELGSRNKRRHSFRHREFQVDLTQVGHYDDATRKEHECEIEIAAMYLAGELQKLREGLPGSNYVDMVQELVNNVRLLCKNAVPRSKA